MPAPYIEAHSYTNNYVAQGVVQEGEAGRSLTTGQSLTIRRVVVFIPVGQNLRFCAVGWITNWPLHVNSVFDIGGSKEQLIFPAFLSHNKQCLSRDLEFWEKL